MPGGESPGESSAWRGQSDEDEDDEENDDLHCTSETINTLPDPIPYFALTRSETRIVLHEVDSRLWRMH